METAIIIGALRGSTVDAMSVLQVQREHGGYYKHHGFIERKHHGSPETAIAIGALRENTISALRELQAPKN
jgi:hypothetical protein